MKNYLNSFFKTDGFEKWIFASAICLMGMVIGLSISLLFQSNADSLEKKGFGNEESVYRNNEEIGNRDGGAIEQNSQSRQGCSIMIDIEGAVEYPGVKCLEEGSILEKALEEAGGFRDDVCILWVSRNINKASIVLNNSKVFIPGVDDLECSDEILASGLSSEVGGIDFSLGIGESANTNSSSKISINHATLDQLVTIKGVGPATAEKIIQGRPYEKLEDIKNVSGIGDTTYENMKDFITL